MGSDRRQQEQREGTEPTGMAWFEMYEALAEFGEALAYPTRYDRSNKKWIRDTFSPQRTVYSLAPGTTAQAGDFVRCYFDPMTRFWEVVQTSVRVYRGVTAAQITKGSTPGNVTRYLEGTNTPAGITDSVVSDLVSVASGKKVTYVKLGSTFYIVSTEKTSQTALTNIREKSDHTQVEAEELDIFVDTVDTAAYADKITITTCP